MAGDVENGIESFERLSFEGWPVGQLATIGLIVGGAILLLSWRDFTCARRPAFVPVLLLLRLAAVAVTLFLLAGPSHVTITEESTPRAVGIFVDTSGSMGVEDHHSDVKLASRWDLVAIRENPADFVALDRAETALRAAIAAIDRSAGDPVALPQCQSAVLSAAQWLEGTGFSTGRKWADTLGAVPDAETERDGYLIAIEVLRGEILELAQSVGRAADAAAEKAPPPTGLPESRLAKTRRWLEWAQGDWLGELSTRSNVRYFAFNESVIRRGGVDALDLPMEIERTNLEGLLRGIAAAHGAGELDAAIVVTDGHQTTSGNPRLAAGGLGGVPTVFVPIGERETRRDIEVEEVQAPRFVYLGDTVEMTATISSYGVRGERIAVTVTDAGEVVHEETVVPLTEASHQRVSIQLKADSRETMNIEVRASGVEGEWSQRNNAKSVSVDIVEDPEQLLIADWLPRWEFRYLANLLRRDSTTSFEELLFQPVHAAQGRELRARPVFPSTADACDRFRLMVLGDLPPSVLTPAVQNVLKDYVVEKGGTLVIVAGEGAMPAAYADQPLAEILPVRHRELASTDRYHWAVTSEGDENPAVQLEPTRTQNRTAWDEVTRALPIYGLSPWSEAKPTARVLLEAVSPAIPDVSRAFLSWHYVGRGRVVYLAAPVTYNLRYRRGDIYHFRFWGQLIRWAGERGLSDQSHSFKLELSKVEASERDSVGATVVLVGADGTPIDDADLQLRLESDGVEIRTVPLAADAAAPGRYRADLDDLPPGDLRVTATGDAIDQLLEAEGVVGNAGVSLAVTAAAAEEMGDTQPDLLLLADIAEASGGILAWPDAVPEAVASWRLAPDVKSTRSDSPAWPRWPVFCILAGLLISEWIGRRLIGLI
ncbi:hypothetical protein BH23VER1_BH23VER1_27370 [soil metagenome]